MAKYTYSRKIKTPDGEETFSAVEFASFDEAQKAVEKGVYDRRLQLGIPPTSAPQKPAVLDNGGSDTAGTGNSEVPPAATRA